MPRIDDEDVVGGTAIVVLGLVERRRDVAESRLDRLSKTETIVTYGAYDLVRLKQLQVLLPDLRSPIQDIMNRRWVDLLQVVRDHYHHRDFCGSYSIKSV